MTYSKQKSWEIFETISKRYDMINRVLSFGMDHLWRKKLAAHANTHSPRSILDIATGTGDQLLEILKKNPRFQTATGIDLSPKMLSVCQKKLQRFEFKDKVQLEHGNAENLLYDSQSFDLISLSFGIRNMPNPEQCLSEMLRVLKKDGKILILEFSLPSKQWIKQAHLFYLRHLLPKIGGLLSKNLSAYKYLNQTIETFPSGEDFCLLLKKVGFSETSFTPLTFGVVTLYEATR